jgi:hypothetical protein
MKPGEGSNTYNLEGLVIDNDFGFGIVRTKSVRLWLGPELRIAFFTGTDESSTGVTQRDVSLVGVGIGPVLGVNFNIGSNLSLCLKTAYLFNSYSGSGEGKQIGATYAPDADYKFKENFLLVNAALMFRIGDD